MMKLGELIFELLSEALGLKANHLKELNCAKSLSLLSHYYPPCPEPDRTFGISSHTDISFITILLQDHIGGLQVLHDGYWIDVPPNPEALIVNLGDLLQANTFKETYTPNQIFHVLTNLKTFFFFMVAYNKR
ncbi:unnamed protein product [Arabidopsis lyrata]|nr:unnamed protein product [Arabidopsis lyrata]